MYGKPTSKGEQFRRLTKFAGQAAQSGLLMATLLIALTPRNVGAVSRPGLPKAASPVAENLTSVAAMPRPGLPTAAALFAVALTSVGAMPRPGLRSFAMLGAAIPASAGAVPRPDPGCFDRCQANLASCLAGAGGDPFLEFQCQVAYNGCGELCMIG